MSQKFLPILYSFRRCPYAIRARMAITYAKIQVELREIILKDKPENFLTLSPKATVPLLKADKCLLVESLEIMLWALNQDDPADWYFGLSSKQRQSINNLIDLNDKSFKPMLDRYKYAARFPEYAEKDYLEFAMPFLSRLDWLLEQNRYLLSEHITLADVALFPFIRQFAFVNKQAFDDLNLYHLNGWLADWLNSKLFNSVMYKYPQWKEGDTAVIFPDLS